MLHRVKLPDCECQLNTILRFQRQVLAFACDPNTDTSFPEAQLQQIFGDEVGAWLWRRLWKQSGKNKGDPTPLQDHLKQLVNFIRQHPTKKQAILAAFDNDVEFHNHFNDPNFKFKFRTDPEIDEATRAAVRPLMEDFYTELLAGVGFDSSIHGQPDTFDRDTFVEAFWRVNAELEVCPACDSPRGDKVDVKVYDDADHFFYKSYYPFLSIHPENLIPLCLYCNQRFKLRTDPVDDHNAAPLQHSFHPYRLPAYDEINVKVMRNNRTVHQVIIEDKAGMPSRRVQNLNNVFKLEERWPDRLRYQIAEIIDSLAGYGRRRTKRGEPVDESILASGLTAP